MHYILIFLIFIFNNSVYALNIDETIKSTIEKNPKVKIAIEKLNESKELIESAYGKKLPSINSTISGTYSNAESKTSSITTTPETFTDRYKISITQNIIDGGIKNLEIKRSKILYDNEVINFQKTIQDLILSAINGYLTVINYNKSLIANQKNFDSVSRFLEETKTRFNLGSATLYDLQNAESAYAIAETNLFAAQNNYDVSKITFKNIVGLNPVNLEEVVDFKQDLNLEKIISNALNNNYEILLIKNEIENKKILLAKEKKSKNPSLDITASAEYSDSGRIDNGSEKTDSSIGLTLTIPIFSQNLDISDRRKYRSQILQSELNLEDISNDISIQAANLYKDYLISKSNISSNIKQIQSIETSLESIKEEYNIGTKSINQLIEAESDLLSVNVNYFASRKEFILNYFNIKALEGSIIDLFKDYLPNYN